MTKFFGIILASILTVIIVLQVKTIAQYAEEPISGPITSPITSPLTSVTPTPTLIQTVSSTPVVSPTATPTESVTQTLTPTVTSTPSVTLTPTPTIASLPDGVTRLGGLNLDGYCNSLGKPWDVINNGIWYCSNGSDVIDMNAACEWQYHTDGVFAFQDRAGDAYSWSCYAPEASVTPTPTVTVAPTGSVTPTVTMNPTQEPSGTITPTLTQVPTITVTPEPTHVASDHHNDFHVPFFFFPRRFPFFIAAQHFFTQPKKGDHPAKNTLAAKTCSMHDRN